MVRWLIILALLFQPILAACADFQGASRCVTSCCSVACCCGDECPCMANEPIVPSMPDEPGALPNSPRADLALPRDDAGTPIVAGAPRARFVVPRDTIRHGPSACARSVLCIWQT
ncbi:MAG: hypothetical protein ACKVW3_06540 [Phycisphaerales bacterium]